MPATGLGGPWALTQSQVNAHAKESIGTYALGYVRSDNDRFVVQYVGRSDENLNSRLHDWLNTKYKHFKCGHFQTAGGAFDKECRIYHDFSPSGNKVHPARPKGSNRPCPISGCEELD